MPIKEISRPGVPAPEREGGNAAHSCVVEDISRPYFTTDFPGLQGRLALKPKEAAQVIGVGNNAIYALCHRADFPAIRVGQSLIIPTDALVRWLNEQVAAGGDAVGG